MRLRHAELGSDQIHGESEPVSKPPFISISVPFARIEISSICQYPGSFRSCITSKAEPFLDAVHETWPHVYVLLVATVVVKIVLELPTSVSGGQVVTDVLAGNSNEHSPLNHMTHT